MMVVTETRADAPDKGYIWLAEQLRTAIASGEFPAGRVLPSMKELGAQHGVSSETARRAAQQLVADGLLSSEPRHGFRVLARANDPERGMPIAFVVSTVEPLGQWNEFYTRLFTGVQKAVADRGWSLLAIGAGKRSNREILAQLRNQRVCGLVIDSMNSALLHEVSTMGLPAVMMDSWDAEMRLDAIVQDSFQGALLATRHLVARGHQRIAWLGPVSESVQSQERFGGAAAGLTAAGLARAEFLQDTPRQKIPETARALLSRPDRPTAVLALWYDAASEIAQAAAEMGLTLGRDLDVVGWTPEESLDTYRGFFKHGVVPPAMVWSATELARVAIARLVERRQHPARPSTLLKVPTRLWQP
jgi:LacI family transcriptional regulator